MNRFDDKIAYITGGSSGIGLAVAKLLAAKGAHILLLARDEQRLRQACAEVEEARTSAGQRVDWRKVDVADNEQVDRVLAEAVRTFGAPDVLLNSAGISNPNYFENVPFAQFDAVMRVNMYGTWNTCAALVPAMKERGGYIVNISSVAGFLGVFGFTAYSASKFAVVGFSESLRAEMKRFGIDVSVLCPPDTDTPMLARENIGKPAETKAISAGAKVMTAERVAQDLLAGMAKKQFMIVPGFESKFTAAAKRLSPALVDWVVERLARRADRYR